MNKVFREVSNLRQFEESCVVYSPVTRTSRVTLSSTLLISFPSPLVMEVTSGPTHKTFAPPSFSGFIIPRVSNGMRSGRNRCDSDDVSSTPPPLSVKICKMSALSEFSNSSALETEYSEWSFSAITPNVKCTLRGSTMMVLSNPAMAGTPLRRASVKDEIRLRRMEWLPYDKLLQRRCDHN